MRAKPFLAFSLSLLVFFVPFATTRAVTVKEAFNMTVSDFHALDKNAEADTIDLILSAVHNMYVGKKMDKQAKCMKELYQPPVGAKTSYLVAKIYEAVGGSLGDIKVANVIIAVVESNCPDS